MKFLDIDGVSRLWEKVKSTFLPLKGGGVITRRNDGSFPGIGESHSITIHNDMEVTSAEIGTTYISVEDINRSKTQQMMPGAYTRIYPNRILFYRTEHRVNMMLPTPTMIFGIGVNASALQLTNDSNIRFFTKDKTYKVSVDKLVELGILEETT